VSVDAYEQYLDYFLDPKTGMLDIDQGDIVLRLYQERNWRRLNDEKIEMYEP
jgi:hypothetical protein